MTSPAPAQLLSAGSQAARLMLRVSRTLDGVLHGEHLGVLPGSGSEPAEARPYVPGDDVRRLDWGVLARTAIPHVRTTTLERELETTLVLDLSPSMRFGTRTSTKLELALTLAAAFAHLASGPGDRLGGVLLAPGGTHRLPPLNSASAGVSFLAEALRRLDRPGPAPSLADALASLPLARRGLVVVLSDLLTLGESPRAQPAWERPLRRLSSRHDVIVVEISDPLEHVLPDLGRVRLHDAESGRSVELNSSNASIRARYAEAARSRSRAHAEAVAASGAAHLALRTDQDWLRELTAFLALRRRFLAAPRSGGR